MQLKLFFAAQVSGANYLPDIDSLADDVIIIEQPENFYVVGQVYEDFHAVTDEEVFSVDTYKNAR